MRPAAKPPGRAWGAKPPASRREGRHNPFPSDPGPKAGAKYVVKGMNRGDAAQGRSPLGDANRP